MKTKRAITGILALCAIVAAIGCGGSNGSGRTRPDAIKGDWSGYWQYGDSRTTGDGTLYLSIGDDAFTGSFTEYGQGSGDAWGERHGDNLDGWVAVGEGEPSAMSVDDLKVNDGRLTGKAKVTTDGESAYVDFALRQDD